MTSTYCDPLETALLRFFDLRNAATAALAALSKLAGDSDALGRRVLRLRSALQAGGMLDAAAEVELTLVLETVEARIAAGTQQHFVSDEHCVSGGGYITHLSRDAEQFSTAVLPLQQLQAAWQDVQTARETERALAQLRS
ncbi:hypothetical protein [Marinovum sp.]|uniref:hypothetical protein n=1 Tax=Marinovum sp. TaxID=2024839 RepID=UPI003A95B7D0